MASLQSKLSPSFTIFFLLFSLLTTALTSEKSDYECKPEKTTHLHLYLHEKFKGPNATAIVVAGLKNPSSSFGDISIIDDFLTEGPDPSSKLIGRAQGIVPQASQEDTAWLMAINFVFTGGEYNGSTITVLGRAALVSKVRELTVVGGTGKFRLARGYDLTKTYSLDSSTGVLVTEHDFYVMHY